MAMRIQDPIALIKPLVFIGALVPLALLVLRGFTDNLGANPVETIEHTTGDWALYFLLSTLAITPLRQSTGWGALVRLRRLLGLFCFFYATLHFSSWLVFDHFFDLNEIAKDIRKRPYVTVGFTAFTLLIPLAATSTSGMIRRLGGARWRRLHGLVYIVGTLVILHYLWLVKKDTQDPIFYAVVLILLLAARAPILAKLRTALTRKPATPAAVTIAR
jgi:sulfoxide reductase heme-binding subunit YedZ